jgi:hypothetical protein
MADNKWRCTDSELPWWGDIVDPIEVKGEGEETQTLTGGFLDEYFDGENEFPILNSLVNASGEKRRIQEFEFWRPTK